LSAELTKTALLQTVFLAILPTGYNTKILTQYLLRRSVTLLTKILY